MSKKKNLILIIVSFIILTSMISALVVEHTLGHQPCNLCLYERIPYILSAILIVKIFLFKKYEKITLFILFFVFILSAILAFYHLGIERGFFDESLACNIENQSTNLSKEQLLKELNKTIVSCKDVSFRVLGLSLATLNSILSVVLSIIFLKLFLNYEKNQ